MSYCSQTLQQITKHIINYTVRTTIRTGGASDNVFCIVVIRVTGHHGTSWGTVEASRGITRVFVEVGGCVETDGLDD